MTLLELFKHGRAGPMGHSDGGREWRDFYPYKTDKGEHNYIKYYSEWFAKYQYKEINLLEVGVEGGWSIYLWKSYFTKGKVYGMDINEIFGGDFKCDSTDKKAVDEQLGDLKFDIIIDDGDHHPESQMKTYMNLKNRLNGGGLYIIEDIYGQKYSDNIYEKEVDKIKSLGFEIIDTKGQFNTSYLGVIRT